MQTINKRIVLVLVASALLGACTHRIEAPEKPIRIEMTVVLKHEFLLKDAREEAGLSRRGS